MLTEFFEKHRGAQLIFALVCGAAYFSVAMTFIDAATSAAAGGGFLAFLFCPAIVCGMALVIIKSIRRFIQAGNKKAVNFLAAAHIIIIAAGIAAAIERIIS